MEYAKRRLQSCSEDIKDAKAEIKEVKLLEKLFKDTKLQDKICDLYTQYFKDTDTYPDVDDDWDWNRIGEIGSVNGLVITLQGLLINNELSYDELVDKATYITYDNKLGYLKEWAFEYSGYTFKLIEGFTAIIPEDDLLVLEMLGKVDVVYHDAYKESRVFCSN